MQDHSDPQHRNVLVITQGRSCRPKRPKTAIERHYGEFVAVPEDGVYQKRGMDNEGEPILQRICSPLILEAITVDVETKEPRGKYFLLGNGNHYHMQDDTPIATVIKILKRRGLKIEPRSRNAVVRYLDQVDSDRTILSSTKLGWVNDTFVLPDDKYLGQQKVIYAGGYYPDGKSPFTMAGDWKENVGKYCRGNSRLMFAASGAFAASLLRLLGIKGGGFHFRGTAQRGKSTALEVAASVYGSAETYGLSWNTTKNAIEQTAEAHNDCLMVMDELGQGDPKIIGPSLYDMANGKGKARYGQEVRTWRVLFLSSGELSLAEHMGEIGKTPKRGQEMRLLEIASDPGAGLGVFETLHEFSTGAELSNHLSAMANVHHGTPLVEFLSVVTASKTKVLEQCHVYVEEFRRRVLPPGASGEEVSTAIRRFGVNAAGGEIATAYDITGWQPGEAMDAAVKCYQSWLQHRNTFDLVAGDVGRIRKFIEENVHRFEAIGGEAVRDKVGYKKDCHFLILSDEFEKACGERKPMDVAHNLKTAAYLEVDKGHHQKLHRVNRSGRRERLYSVSDKILKSV